MIEHSHLKIIQALDNNGTLTEAANALCLSQSALSHQIRYLEKKLEISLWKRDGRRLRLTQAGQLLLQTAQQVLPVLKQTESTLKAYSEGRQGILRIGVECFPCYEWLTGVVGVFLERMPDVDIDIINKFQFSGLEGLLNHHIDTLVTPDKETHSQIIYQVLAEYQVVLLVPDNHALAKKKSVTAKDFSQEILLAFPVPSNRLDILTHFLNPANIQPQAIKKIESIELMLQMVAYNRGICVLPEWLANNAMKKLPVKQIKIGKTGMQKKLYVALREQDKDVPYLQQFISIGKEMAEETLK
jgi:LysR family transcriptional regulator for metE and metH